MKAAANNSNSGGAKDTNDLIVMQTFGEEAVGREHGAVGSENWVNDALIPENSAGSSNGTSSPT